MPGEAARLDVDFDAVGLSSEVERREKDQNLQEASKQWLKIYAMPVTEDALATASAWLLRDEVDDRHLVTRLAVRTSSSIFSAPEVRLGQYTEGVS